MLCNGNVPDANSPINFKNDSFCPTSSRDFSTLSNKSIMSLISIDSESHWGISFPEGQHTFIWIPSFSKSFPSFWLFFRVWKRFLQKFSFTGVFSFFLLDSLSSMQVKPSLTVMHLPYLVKLDGTTPSCIFVWYLCILVFSSNTSCRYFNVSSPCDSLQCSIILCKGLSCIPQ